MSSVLADAVYAGLKEDINIFQELHKGVLRKFFRSEEQLRVEYLKRRI